MIELEKEYNEMKKSQKGRMGRAERLLEEDYQNHLEKVNERAEKEKESAIVLEK